MPYTDEDLLRQVNSNGYLLQQAVEHVVRQRPQSYDGWTLVATEHFWQHPDRDKYGYVDVLIANNYGLLAVVECKRVKEDTPWIFLRPRDRAQNARPEGVRASKLHWVHHEREDHHKNNQRGLDRFIHGPTTATAKFCIVVGQTNERPMLERVAGDLIYAVEAIAQQQLNFNPNGATLLLPLILTNASLYICDYGLDQVEAVNGVLRQEDAQLTSVPYIRFEKVYTDTPVDYGRVYHLNELEVHQRQTVMVVNSNHLSTFLDECQRVTAIDRYGDFRWPWQRE